MLVGPAAVWPTPGLSRPSLQLVLTVRQALSTGIMVTLQQCNLDHQQLSG